eukprot:GFUD01135973.1.p1 GENE.GFUD01135973.1~~GFUD01135973.1.p1  ORF type:complete len:475 (-),score=53.31 GFUD01135973.1:131-1555(-)
MLRKVPKLLKPNYRFCLRSSWKSTKTPDAFSKHGERETLEENLSPEVFKLLVETKTIYKNRLKLVEVTVHDRIQSYKKGYIEKAVLLNEETAAKIAQSVQIHSRGDQNTTFFDGEGGLCQIAAIVSKIGLFKEVCVLEKDMCLESLHEYAKSKYLDPSVPVYDLNLTKVAVDGGYEKQRFVSPLLKYLPSGDVSEEVPASTIVTTASHGFVKYLISRMLHRDNPFGEFYSSRPEFFLIVTARTYFHLCCGINDADPSHNKLTEEEMRIKNKLVPMNAQLSKVYNVIFQVYFDFCLVDVLPRKSYFPWKPHKRYAWNNAERLSNTRGVDKLYEENHNRLMLMYVRPKRPKDLEMIGNPAYFEYFLTRILQRKTRRIVGVFEEWSSGWGLLIVEAGFTIFDEVRDLDLEDLLQLFHLLKNIPNFEQSNFVAEANMAFKANHETEDIDELLVDKFRINLWRKISKGADSNENISKKV